MKDVRIFFKKTGRMKFISHLDLNRFMIRMIRRSEIPVWYSEGFNPHPYITFALPLSLGFESTYDIMDMRLNDDGYPLTSALKKLKTVMPEGIELIGIGEPVMKAGSIGYAKYEIDYTGINENIKTDLLEFLSSDEILTEKKTKKGKINTIDLAPSIKEFKFDKDKLVMVLASGGANNLNPKLVLETFENKFDVKLPFAVIVRTMLYNTEMEEFK